MAHYLSSQSIRKKTGDSRRHLARLAADIPGAIRLDGYHWSYEDTPKLQEWVRLRQLQNKISKVRRLKSRRESTNQGVSTLSDLVIEATRAVSVLNHCIDQEPIEKWSIERIREAKIAFDPLLDKLMPLADFAEKLEQAVKRSPSAARSRLSPA